MGILYGLAPWIVYWVLVGNVPIKAAVLVALAIAIAVFALGQTAGKPGHVNYEIIPGITCYTGGRHTYASQYVGVSTRAGTVVLTVLTSFRSLDHCFWTVITGF